MLSVFYYIAFLMAFCFVVAIASKPTAKNRFVLLGSVCVLLGNGGYYCLSVSRTVEEAILANKVAYTGGVFLPLLVFLGTLYICKIKIPAVISSLLLAICLAMLFIVYSVGRLPIYYKSVTLGSRCGASILVKEYGSLHGLFSLYLLAFVVFMTVFLIYAFRRGSKISYKYAISLTIIVAVNAAAYCFERILDIPFEVLAFSYVFSELLLVRILQKRSEYGINGVGDRVFDKEKEAFFVLDYNNRYMGHSPAAAAILPELMQLPLEKEITEGSIFLYDKLSKLLGGETDSPFEDCLFFRNGREYRLTARELYGIGRKKDEVIGTLLHLQDETKQQRYLRMMSSQNEELSRDVEIKTDHIRVMHDKLIFGMADMVESRDPNTGGHIKRTSGVVKLLTTKLLGCKELGLTEDFLSEVAKAAPMHDLGKISIDDAILRKPGVYTKEEYECMKKHAAKGAEIVSQIIDQTENESFYRIAVNVAHYHHEKWDGTGYPDHLRGEEIPIEARIMALADVFDALVSKRCYKEAFSFDKAFQIIEESLGSHFNPEIGRVFLECREDLIAFYMGALDEA